MKIGRKEPVRTVRFNIVPMGKNNFDVIERATGRSRGERLGHDGACQYAEELEQIADFTDAVKSTSKRFGALLLRWTIGFAAMLVAFAYYGAQH